MCNPRRVEVIATRDIAEAWEAEVSRSVSLSAEVTGEARICEPLSSTLASPVMNALENLLENGTEGWQEIEQGYRHDVEGGYVVYNIEATTLEIVAALQDHVKAEASATEIYNGMHRETLTTKQEGKFYDDGWGGRTESVAKAEAEKSAQQALDKQAQSRMQAIRQQAEQQHADTVRAKAEEKTQAELIQKSQQVENVLAEQARENLDTVGLRCRQAFNTLLGVAYRDVIMAYARRNGAEDISCQDNDDVIEIEFFMDK